MKMAGAMMRLSTGLRINRAADDPAGFAISEKMRAQIRGLRMAARNAADAISLIQIAEGALGETHAILQRMRELAIQAANDTNTDDDRKSIQDEIKQLTNEINRIGNTTEFNTKKLLDGSHKGITEEITGTMRMNNNSGLVIDLDKMSDTQKSIAKDKNWAFDGAYMLIKTNQTVDSSYTAEFNVDDYKLIGPDGKIYDFTVVYEEIEEEVISEETGELETIITLIYTGTVTTEAGIVTITRDGIQFSENAENNFTADIHALKPSESLTFVFTEYKAASSDLANSLMLQIGANSGQTMFLSIGDMRAGALGISGVDVGTRFGASMAIETINNAIQTVSRQRSALGATQNRLEHTIRNLETTAENLQAAESRIRDADMVREMMEFAKYSILQQAAQAMLVQANMNQRSMLRLLEAI
jgi:flagellin